MKFYYFSFSVDIIQNGNLVHLVKYIAAERVGKKIYKPETLNDWTGIIWHGLNFTVPRDSPVCGWKGEFCDVAEEDNTVLISILAVFGVLFFFIVIVSTLGIRKYRYETALKQVEAIKVNWNDIDSADISIVNSLGIVPESSIQIVKYRDEYVTLENLASIKVNFQDRQVLIELKEMRKLDQENINPFIGVCDDSLHSSVLMAYAVRGSLQDIIRDEDTTLDWSFKRSILDDITCGLSYLHQSVVKYHGRLTSSRCVVDSHWTCKVTGHGLRYIKQQSFSKPQQENPSKLLWTAPELLQTDIPKDADIFTMADVFSFGIIAQEVILQDVPYGRNNPILDAKDIIDKLRLHQKPPYRPTLPNNACHTGWKDLVESCWQEQPEQRPKFSQILGTIDHMNKGKHVSLVDNIIQRLESYTRKLEDRVADRAKELKEEKDKVEIILNELLPTSVAHKLSLGYRVEPETFDNVTIFFSDIVGFTLISAKSDALQIVVMLNQMYITFDDIAHQFDVYKVATIGDAYVVASGVPTQNGNKHGAEICAMSVALLDAIQEFDIPHLKDEHLLMRIGIHSGSCVAGVVGIKMPRYLLFGDTVETAAKMESGGDAMRIHVSETTQRLIHDNPNFHVVKRGTFLLKDKGLINSFWLTKAG